MSIQALREQKAALTQAARAYLDDHEDSWTDANMAEYKEMMDKFDPIDAAIGRHERLMDKIAVDGPQTFEQAMDEAAAYRLPASAVGKKESAFTRYARYGERGLDQEEQRRFSNTMSTTTDSEGGYTVETEVVQEAMDAMAKIGSVRQVATVLPTEKGNPINFPTTDGTAEEGELIAENTTATGADIVFGVQGLNTYKFSSKIIAIPFELLQDSAINVEALVRDRCVARIGRAANGYFTTGTGTAQPRGVVTASAEGKVGATGQTTSVLYTDLIDLMHSVDPAYREEGTCRFMLHDTSLAAIRKISDSAGRPIFIPGYAGLGGPVPDTILGQDISINQKMAVMAADAKSILYGDFSKYIVRDVMALTLFRFTDSAYAKLGQVGFLMWSRHGGQYTDVGDSLKHYANSST